MLLQFTDFSEKLPPFVIQIQSHRFISWLELFISLLIQIVIYHGLFMFIKLCYYAFSFLVVFYLSFLLLFLWRNAGRACCSFWKRLINSMCCEYWCSSDFSYLYRGVLLLHPFVSICSEDFDPHIDATVVAEGLGYCCGVYFVFRFQLPTAEFEVIELLIWPEHLGRHVLFS